MTTSNSSSVLNDVVAYVDVWSSDKMANCSKPFIDQLREMGAQVSKTFNKQVTHVVFYNGHPATWRKAKKCNVRLVSVLWIERCLDDGVHVDEELFPALNDESNPVLRNKRHRCMQPKDSPEKTPENDRRMRKKLDKMMKDLVPKPTLATHVSSIIIDKENGIVYSPGLKRSDYMAQRLKDMKDKRENLSPTASQMVESCSPTELKPSLGSTPTVLRLTFEESDEDSSVSIAESVFSPDKNEGREYPNVTELKDLKQCHMKDSTKPWDSPRHYSPKRTSVLSCSDQEGKKHEEGIKKKSRKSSGRKMPGQKSISGVFLESTSQNRRSSNSKNIFKESRQSQIIPFCQTLQKSEKQKTAVAESVTETEFHVYSGTLKSATCSTSPAVIDSAEIPEETASPLDKAKPKTHKRVTSSFSALVQSLVLSGESNKVAAVPSSRDDSFEDFFSPSNDRQRPKNRLLCSLAVGGRTHIPFELEPSPKKSKQRRTGSWGSESISKKIRKLENGVDSQNSQNVHLSDESKIRQQRDVTVDRPGANVKQMAVKQGQNTLDFTSTTETSSEKGKLYQQMSAQLREDNTVLDRQKDFGVNSLPHTSESRGSNCTVAAGFTKSPSETEENQNKKVCSSLQKMVHKTKVMRTMVMTSMPTEKQHTVVQVVKALGGFSIVDRVCESTTHVVSGAHKRTLNILLGIARGCWILSFEWILWCLEQRKWIQEEPYELSDQFPAAQICRLQRHLSAGEHQQDLFEGLPAIFVSHHSQPPTQSLVELIELCGGTVCRTVRQAGICIGKYGGRRPEGSRVLSEQWVLDSITQLKQLSYDNYDLE